MTEVERSLRRHVALLNVAVCIMAFGMGLAGVPLWAFAAATAVYGLGLRLGELTERMKALRERDNALKRAKLI